MSEDIIEENVEANLDLEKGWLGKAKDSLISNWETIIIALIVLIIGVGLYNYQQQKDESAMEGSGLSIAIEEQEEEAENLDEKIAIEMDKANETDIINSGSSDEKNEKEDETVSAVSVENNNNEEETESSVTVSSENGKAYQVSADKGDGITNLARKALREYLEENNISDVSNEQKVFVEDYLQNRTGQELLNLGESRSFSESLIKEAIDQSRGLDSNALENLSGYTTRIANL